MGMVYLPTWMVDFCGKCRKTYQSHGTFPQQNGRTPTPTEIWGIDTKHDALVNAFRLQIWLSFWVYIYLLNFNQKFNFQAKILLSFLCVLGQRFLDVYYLIFAIAPSNIFVTTHILRWLNHKISECFHWSCFFPKLKFVYETDNNTEIRQNPKIIIMFSPAGSIPDDEKFKSFSQFWSFKSFAKQHKKHRLPKGPDTPSK